MTGWEDDLEPIPPEEYACIISSKQSILIDQPADASDDAIRMGTYFTQRDGRVHHNSPESPYWLPVKRFRSLRIELIKCGIPG
jgi:hypothetical protein